MKSRTSLAALLVAAGALLCATGARADLPDYFCLGTEPTCNGKTPTICGTEGPDTIIGTGQADVIVGLGDADFIKGLGGDDTI